MKNGDATMQTIILAGHCLLVKMLITLEPYHMFWSILHSYTFYEKGRENDKEKKRKK